MQGGNTREIIKQNCISMDCMKVITNMNTNRKCLITNNDLQKANELNDFYLRFKTQDFSLQCINVLETTTDSSFRLLVDTHNIQSLYRHVCTNKSTDGLFAVLIETCAEEFTPAWCPVFQRSVNSHAVPALWKNPSLFQFKKKKTLSN